MPSRKAETLLLFFLSWIWQPQLQLFLLYI